jgi:hypothetical protein
MPENTSAKKAALELIRRLDDDVTFEDILYELHALQKIRRGQQDVQDGRVVDHEEVKDRLDERLS